MSEASLYFKNIADIFYENSSTKSTEMSAYMRDQWDFYGIIAPKRTQLIKAFIQQHPIPKDEALRELVLLCWEAEEREMQYIVRDLVTKSLKKMDLSWLDTFEYCITHRSWWDTVDFIAPHLCASIFLRFPAEIEPRTQRWIDSDNIWLQRSAIIFQLHYKEKTNEKLLFKYILRRSDSREFFVQKASGWALREYGKRNPQIVLDFVTKNPHLAPLTKREALKSIPK